MGIASQLVRRRRLVAIGAATVLLHYLAAGWVGAGAPAAGSRPEAPVPVPVPVPVLVLLRAPAPMPMPVPLPLPVQAPAVPALPRPRPGAAEASAAVAAAPVQSAPATAAVSGPGRYRASVPPAADLHFDVVRSDARGDWSGRALLRWQRSGAAYQLRHTGELTLPEPGELFDMASEGSAGADGIVPRTMTEKRRGRARTATHFSARENVTFSATEHAVAMAPGAQDKASVPMQLAAIARAGAAQLAQGVEMMVGEDKDASVYRFVVLGQEQIASGMGTLATWHLARLSLPGSYNARLDIWLAPGYEWYPVQLRSTEANGTVTTQTVREIVVEDAGN